MTKDISQASEPCVYQDPLSKLLTCGSIEEKNKLRKKDGWIDYIHEFRFTDEHVPELIRMACDNVLSNADTESLEVWAPAHAWRVLGQLKAASAVQQLIELSTTSNDDWLFEDLPDVFGMIGAPAIACLRTYVVSASNDPKSIIPAFAGLMQIKARLPKLRSQIVEITETRLTRFADNDPEINGFLIWALLDLNSVESIDLIRKAFQSGNVDASIAGDLEEVESNFGLIDEVELPAPQISLSIGERFKGAISSIANRVIGNRKIGEAIEQPSVPQKFNNIGRNDSCPCGSGKKYKKCCLTGGAVNPNISSASRANASNAPGRQCVATMTGEVFLPIRLYYIIHSKSGVEDAFSKIRCMDYDEAGDRWTWLFDDEARNLKFEKPYSSIPIHKRPIILGSFYTRIDTEMYLDIGSRDRAIHAVKFFDKHIKRSVAEVEFFAIYNKITTSEAEHPGHCFDKLFAEVRTDLIDQRMEEHLATTVEAVKAGRLFDIINDRKFNLVEAHRVHYYDEGISQLETCLKMRETVAVARWSGKTDYCMNDLIKSVVLRSKTN